MHHKAMTHGGLRFQGNLGIAPVPHFLNSLAASNKLTRNATNIARIKQRNVYSYGTSIVECFYRVIMPASIIAVATVRHLLLIERIVYQ